MYIFLCFFRQLELSLIHKNNKNSKNSTVCFVRLVMTYDHAEIRFPTLKPQFQKFFPWRANYPVGFPKSLIHFSSVLAGVSCNSLVRLAEQNMCYGRLPFVDSIISIRLLIVSKYSSC